MRRVRRSLRTHAERVAGACECHHLIHTLATVGVSAVHSSTVTPTRTMAYINVRHVAWANILFIRPGRFHYDDCT